MILIGLLQRPWVKMDQGFIQEPCVTFLSRALIMTSEALPIYQLIGKHILQIGFKGIPGRGHMTHDFNWSCFSGLQGSYIGEALPDGIFPVA